MVLCLQIFYDFAFVNQLDKTILTAKRFADFSGFFIHIAVNAKNRVISVFAKKYYSAGIETGRSEEVWILQDISKVKDSFVSKEELGFYEEYE